MLPGTPISEFEIHFLPYGLFRGSVWGIEMGPTGFVPTGTTGSASEGATSRIYGIFGRASETRGSQPLANLFASLHFPMMLEMRPDRPFAVFAFLPILPVSSLSVLKIHAATAIIATAKRVLYMIPEMTSA
jgi:hypothetical protein